MVGDDLITVPSSFRCPLSLDVMKSPVSLCTGVTYDRSSIQRWLDNGNTTCPATMYVLHSKEFVPNRTLHKLIHNWSDSVRLVGLLDSVEGGVTGSVEFLEKVVYDLDSVLNKLVDRQQLKILMLKQGNCLASLLLVLRQGSSGSKIRSARILKFIAVDSESKLLIAEKEGLISELLKSIAPYEDSALIDNALSCLVEISMPRRNTYKLVQLGAIKMFSQLLSGSNWSASITENVLKLLEMVSSTEEGRSQICEDPTCVLAILQKVWKVSRAAAEHAVTILWGLCCLFRDQKAREAVITANGLTEILLLFMSDCSPAVRQMSNGLLTILRVKSKSCLFRHDGKNTHIRPF